MSALDGRVCIVTGAGRGIGREHALRLAAEGARVVVNDLGGGTDGGGADEGPAHGVVSEIRDAGGEAIANTDSVADWDGARRLVRSAVEAFGDLHVLVNNAGILRNRVLVHMTEEELDAVLRVHLKGHFGPSKWAAEFWREQTRRGDKVTGSIVNTVSGTMLGTPGLSNYTAAKAGIAAVTISWAMELGRYGVRVNALAPIARTRLAHQNNDQVSEMVEAPKDDGAFDLHHPANISPLVAYLATEACPFTGGVFHAGGNEVGLFGGWSLRDDDVLLAEGQWTVEDLARQAPQLLEGRGGFASAVTLLEDTYLGRRALQGSGSPRQ